MSSGCVLDFWKHVFEQVFKRHRMGAALVGDEEFTITGKFAIVEGDVMVVVVSMKCHFEFMKDEAFAFFGIAFGFFDFSYHTVVHVYSPYVKGNEKGTQEERAFQSFSSWLSVNTVIIVFTLKKVYDDLVAESTG